MKKSKKMLTICGRIVVLLCVCIAACCAQDYEQLHTVAVSDTIQTDQTGGSSEIETDILSETTPITKSITFCEETQCYEGIFLSLYTDYAKSELTTDIISIDETAEIVVSGTFITDTSGDMIRLIVRFYGDGMFLSENVQKGITLTDCTTDVTMTVTVPDQCDGIVISVQAKYDSKKGGSRNDIVKFLGLCVTGVISDCVEDIILEENITADVTSDETADMGTSLEIPSLHEEETDDVTSDKEETFDLTDDISDEYLSAVLTNLKTDYNKSEVVFEPINIIGITDVTIDAVFESDSSGDMVRVVIYCYNEDDCLIESKALSGMRLIAEEPAVYQKHYTLPMECIKIRCAVQAKYETKRGGSKEDIIVCRGKVIIHNS